MAKRCNVCNKPFKNAAGVSVHKQRTPACGGKKMTWGIDRPSVTSGGRKAIHEILADHPQGLEVAKIRAKLESRGLNLNTNYISQAATKDPSIIRVQRGKYRLKNRDPGSAVVQEAATEAKMSRRSAIVSDASLNLPRETLLLRIETLETQNRALQDAHLSLMRGIFV